MEHILNQANHYNRTDKYNVVTSKNIVEFMNSRGYYLTSVQAARTVKSSKDGFQRHVLRFGQDGQLDSPLRPEIVIMNSYDGSQSLRVMLGIYRVICANGLVVGSSVFEYRIRHSGETAVKLSLALEAALQAFPTVNRQIDAMVNTEATFSQVCRLKDVATRILVPKEAIQVDAAGLDMARRQADRATDLFTAFNRIQENALNGKLSYVTLDKQEKVVYRKVRRVTSIDKRIKLNQELWETAVRLAA